MNSFIQPKYIAGLSCLALMLGALACGGLTPSVSTQPAATTAPGNKTDAAVPGKIPNLTIQPAWGGEPITLPAPIDPERTIYRTPQYRRWQYGGSTDDLTWVDPSGVTYVVQAVSKAEQARSPVLKADGAPAQKKKSKKAGSAKNVQKMVFSRYRVTSPTLENVTTWSRDGRLENWVTYGPDGISRQMKVQMRAREFCPQGVALIQYVLIYESDRIRQFQVNDRNVAWQEVETGESGNVRKRLHEDASQADKLQLMKR